MHASEEDSKKIASILSKKKYSRKSFDKLLKLSDAPSKVRGLIGYYTRYHS